MRHGAFQAPPRGRSDVVPGKQRILENKAYKFKYEEGELTTSLFQLYIDFHVGGHFFGLHKHIVVDPWLLYS